jgi:hypothetical protein
MLLIKLVILTNSMAVFKNFKDLYEEVKVFKIV